MNIPEYNIAPINAFIAEYDKHLETRENDVCMTLGRFSIGRAPDSDNPADCTPIDCGNCTIIRPCMNYLDCAQVKTKFTQGKDGIAWETLDERFFAPNAAWNTATSGGLFPVLRNREGCLPHLRESRGTAPPAPPGVT